MSAASILSKITIRNFKLVRNHTEYDLTNASYFIGPNNAGKSTVLKAIQYFFDQEAFAQDDDFLNRTERLSKKRGSSKSEIAITFDVTKVNGARLREALKKEFGGFVSVTKEVSLTQTGSTSTTYRVIGELNSERHGPILDDDIAKLVGSIKINYLHPQQGDQLLQEAQQKLKRRLLDNWGRRDQRITVEMRRIEEQWDQFKTAANRYLSASLNENTQKMWPESSVTIGLPDNIRDILDISQISFSETKNSPLINLSDQGAGAQSLILYFTHYMLDSDRTLSRATEHHPVWLVEEPESFLHYNLISKLADEFNSSSWSQNIQLLVSTHSSILLAKSRSNEGVSTWHLLENDSKPTSKHSSQWTISEIDHIGKVLGDLNFKLYFEASVPNDQVFLEDSKPSTIQAFELIGINVSHAIGGVGQMKNMIEALHHIERQGNPPRITFIIDNDNGKTTLKHLFGAEVIKESEFTLIAIKELENAYFLLLPDQHASEDLYDELDDILDMALNQVLDAELNILPNPPSYLSKATIAFRDRRPESRSSAKRQLKVNPDFKAFFWKHIIDNNLKIGKSSAHTIKKLLRYGS